VAGVRAAVVAAIAVASGVSGCGGGEETEKVSPEVVASAIGKVNLAGGLQVRMRSESTDDASKGQKTAITGTGVLDVNNGLARMRLDLTEVGQLVEEASGRDVNAADFVGEVVRTYLTLYRRFPFITKGAGIRQEWIASQVPPEPAIGAEGVDFSQLPRINGNDLVQTFEDMTYLVDAVRRPDEHRTIAGAETTRYDAKVDIAATPGAGADPFRSLTGATRYPVKVWIDERGFARAVEWTVSHRVATADPNRLQNSTRTTEVTIERIGIPVRVKAPPKSDTIDQSKVGTLGI
jgi:hypothetical protein